MLNGNSGCSADLLSSKPSVLHGKSPAECCAVWLPWRLQTYPTVGDSSACRCADRCAMLFEKKQNQPSSRSGSGRRLLFKENLYWVPVVLSCSAAGARNGAYNAAQRGALDTNCGHKRRKVARRCGQYTRADFNLRTIRQWLLSPAAASLNYSRTSASLAPQLLPQPLYIRMYVCISAGEYVAEGRRREQNTPSCEPFYVHCCSTYLRSQPTEPG